MLKYSSNKYIYGIVRLDITRNFYCEDFVKIIKSYSAVKHPFFRKMPSIICGSTLEYGSLRKKIVIYDKAKEFDSHFKREDKKLEHFYNKLGRIEFRYLGTKGNESFIKDLKNVKKNKDYECKYSLPFLLPKRVVKEFSLCNELLFDILFFNISKLGSSKLVTNFINVKEFSHIAVHLNPEILQPLISCLSKSTRYRFEKEHREYMSNIKDINIAGFLKLEFLTIAV